MPLLIAVTVIIQACFIYHVLKTGRPVWWAFIILSAPIIGCIAYYFLEVFPGSQEHRSARKTARSIAKALAPDASLQERVAAAQTCDSIQNKVQLARECAERGMHEEAVALYRGALTGPFERDTQILIGLAQSLVEQGGFDDAAATLDRIVAVDAKFKPHELALLRARVLEGRGENDAALAAYREVVKAYVGFEARCRYAMLLERLGHGNQAAAAFEEVLAQAKRNPPGVEAEQAWVKLARQHAAAT